MLHGDNKKGFTIPELLVALTLSVLVVLLVYGVIRLSKRVFENTSAQVGEDVLTIAPAPAAARDALRVHSLLATALLNAKCVYVLGGRHTGIDLSSPEAAQKPVAASALPTLDIAAKGLPTSSWDFGQIYAAELGGADAAAGDKDFTVVVIGPRGGTLGATALVQVRSSSVAISDGTDTENFVRQTTMIWTEEESAMSDFLERAHQVSPVAIGARHSWFRFLSGKIREEGPATVVFPDPYRITGASESDTLNLQSFSRWIYALEVTP